MYFLSLEQPPHPSPSPLPFLLRVTTRATNPPPSSTTATPGLLPPPRRAASASLRPDLLPRSPTVARPGSLSAWSVTRLGPLFSLLEMSKVSYQFPFLYISFYFWLMKTLDIRSVLTASDLSVWFGRAMYCLQFSI